MSGPFPVRSSLEPPSQPTRPRDDRPVPGSLRSTSCRRTRSASCASFRCLLPPQAMPEQQ